MRGLIIAAVAGLVALVMPMTAQAWTFQQTKYRWRNDDGGEAAATWKGAGNASVAHLATGGNLRVRFQVANLVDEASSTSWRLSWSESEDGPWTPVPTAATTEPFEMAESPHVADGVATTAQLGSVVFTPGCVVEKPSTTTPVISVGASPGCTEVEYCIRPTASAVAGRHYFFQVESHWDEGGLGALLVYSSGQHDPVAADASREGWEDEGDIAVTLIATDPDGDPLTYTITAQPGHGALTGSGNQRRYLPAAGWSGKDTFKFKVNDGGADSNEGTVTILVHGTNDEPVIDSYSPAQICSVAVGSTLTFTVNASDPDEDTLSYAWEKDDVKLPGQTSKSFAYTPASGDVGHRVIEVQVGDGHGAAKYVVWSVTVTGSSKDPGDLNGDKVVNIDDLTLVTAHFGQTSSSPGWDARADANEDGVVNVDDLTSVTANFGKTY